MSETKTIERPERFTWEEGDAVLEVVSKMKAQRSGSVFSSLYVNRPLLNVFDVMNWAWKAGFKSCLDPSQLHVTVCFSKSPVDWSKYEPASVSLKNVGGHRIVKELGTAIVLGFDSPNLKHRHMQIMSGGASFDFAYYHPHITITYNKDGFDPLKISEIEPYRGRLEFGEEKFEPVDESWKTKVKETILDPNILNPLTPQREEFLS